MKESSPSEGRQRGRLLQILGVGFGLAVIIGNTIGAGILRTPGEVANQLPVAWMFIGIWMAGGIYALLGALSIAELGTMIPRSGGQYVFAHHALGDYAGFVVGWSDWISTCGTSAAVSVVIGEYLGVLVPALAGKTVAIALAIVMAFAVLQWRGIKWGSQVQNVTSLLKALAFVALIIACFALGGRGSTASAAAETAPGAGVTFLAVVTALQAVIYTYDGWTGVVYFSEEVRDPSRDIPRSIFGGVLSIIAIYLLVNFALLYILPISQIAGSNLAMGAAAQVIFGQHGDTIIRSLTIISMLSAINACQLMATRVLFAMSRDGLVSSRVVKVNKGGTPTAALLASTAIAVLFIFGGSFEKSQKIFDSIIAVLAFFFVVNYAVSFLSVFVLRWREPGRERPYRAWGYPVTTALTLAGSVAFLGGIILNDIKNSATVSDFFTSTSFYSLALLSASYPVFHLLKRMARSK
ncbi:MAG TPA: APC family permease [Blastocatellia bacterium]|nr:APC family permease [Blastocatellia bacterium]